MNVVVAILGLALLVLIHEAGHFFTALAVGMRPRRFYVGFPPPLLRIQRRGIEYGIGAIPLGGYVKIPGMHRPAPSDVDLHFGQAREEEPRLLTPTQRVKDRLAEGDIEGASSLVGELEAALDQTELSPRAEKAARRGLRELRDGFGGDAYWRQRVWKRVAVIFAGPGTNFLFAAILFAALLTTDTYRLGFALQPDGNQATSVVQRVSPGDPADLMDLRPGDRIIAVDGRDVGPGSIAKRIRSSKGKPITLTVQRGSERVTLGPARAKKDEGLSVPAATWESLRLTALVTKEIGASLVRLVHEEGRDEVASPVGIVEGSKDALAEGVETYLLVLGLLSLSLALLNLLPLLPLDGGHIAFSLVEGVRGRAIGREVYERVSAVGIVLVVLLFFIGLSNDLGGREE